MTQRKPSKYRSIMQENLRYRIDYNPLQVLLSESHDIAKAIFNDPGSSEIERILDAELQEEFKLGGHPDFDYLLEGIVDDSGFETNRVQNIQICSLFVDLRNFTKRALFVEDPGVETLDEIASLKHLAISTWIKLARFYQGHIHSITGDGIMVLMGGKQPQDQDQWTTGARTFLLAMRIIESTDVLNERLKDILKQKNQEAYVKDSNLLDIKVGIEFSPNTLMNPQGVIVNAGGLKPIGEVKATSFEIDFSAKLLQFYSAAKSLIDGSPQYGRLLLVGDQFKELMSFSDQASIVRVGTYERQMFGSKKVRYANFIDCTSYKHQVITLDDVAALCDVYDASEERKAVSFDIARGGNTIQHG